MGGMRRTIECISITEDDKHAYCGTRTGDVLKFKIDRDDIDAIKQTQLSLMPDGLLDSTTQQERAALFKYLQN